MDRITRRKKSVINDWLSMVNDNMSFKFDIDNRIIKVYRVTDQHDMTTMSAIDDKYLIWEEKSFKEEIADAVSEAYRITKEFDSCMKKLLELVRVD